MFPYFNNADDSILDTDFDDLDAYIAAEAVLDEEINTDEEYDMILEEYDIH